jgi:hypothetical protein
MPFKDKIEVIIQPRQHNSIHIRHHSPVQTQTKKNISKGAEPHCYACKGTMQLKKYSKGEELFKKVMPSLSLKKVLLRHFSI